MSTVILVLFLLVTLALIGVILIQRSEGGGLGIGSSQGMGSFMTGRGTANLLTRATAVLGTLFFLLSLTLDRKSTRLNSSHANISYAVFCLKKKNIDLTIAKSKYL